MCHIHRRCPMQIKHRIELKVDRSITSARSADNNIPVIFISHVASTRPPPLPMRWAILIDYTCIHASTHAIGSCSGCLGCTPATEVVNCCRDVRALFVITATCDATGVSQTETASQPTNNMVVYRISITIIHEINGLRSPLNRYYDLDSKLFLSRDLTVITTSSLPTIFILSWAKLSIVCSIRKAAVSSVHLLLTTSSTIS